MASVDDRPGPPSGRALAFVRLYQLGTALAATWLLVAGGWVVRGRPFFDARLKIVVAAWALAIAGSLVMLVLSRRPTGSASTVAQIVALLATAAAWGALHGAPSGARAALALAGLSFFAIVVVSPTLGAAAPRATRHPAG